MVVFERVPFVPRYFPPPMGVTEVKEMGLGLQAIVAKVSAI